MCELRPQDTQDVAPDPDADPYAAQVLVHAARYVRLNGEPGDGWFDAVLILRRAYRQVRDAHFGA